MSTAVRYDVEELKVRLPMPEVVALDGIEMRRSGPYLVAQCPFHSEKSGSFTIYDDHAHCFGCGWNGDIIAFWQERRGLDFLAAVAALASLASLPAAQLERKQIEAARVPRMSPRVDDQQKTPALPPMRWLKKEEMDQLASLRGLDVHAVAYAAGLRRVGACLWPQYYVERHGIWAPDDSASPCWVVTDSKRRVVQFRRLDGEKFTRRDGGRIKAWTKGSPTWPLGASEVGDRGCVLLVEGGADMLAAWHHLIRFGRHDEVAVVAMLGGSCSIAEDALPFFARKRVRIIMDADPARPKPGRPDQLISPGTEAAARWSRQLSDAGAAVEAFSLEGLYQRNGQPVKDVNDLAFIPEGEWADPELRAAFLIFDF